MRRLICLAAILLAAPSHAGFASEDPPSGTLFALDEPAPLVLDTSLERQTPALPARERGPQHYPTLPPEPALPSLFDRPPSGLDLLSGGMQGGLMGALAGGGFAYLIQAASEDRAAETSFAGGAIGWAMGSTLGIHVANRKEGDLPLILGVSYLAAAAFCIVAAETDAEALIVPYAVVQLGIGVATARGTRRTESR